MKKRFSLIELIIVIAIVALSAGLFIPAMSSANAEAKNDQCAYNLKQAALMHLMYASDNEDMLPYNNVWTGGYVMLLSSGGYHTSNTDFLCPDGLNFGMDKGGGTDLTGKTSAFLNPAYGTGFVGADEQAAKYGINKLLSEVQPDMGNAFTPKSSKIILAADTGAAGDKLDNYNPGLGFQKMPLSNRADSGYWGALIMRHENSCNAVMLDGHVEALNANDLRGGGTWDDRPLIFDSQAGAAPGGMLYIVLKYLDADLKLNDVSRN